MSRLRRTSALALAGLLALAGVAAAAAAEDEEVSLEVRVAAEANGEPIAGAAVYVKFTEERSLRRDKKLEWKVKTNEEGKAALPPIPAGEVLIQVIAKGWKTFGRRYTLHGPKQTVEIKLVPPKKWY